MLIGVIAILAAVFAVQQAHEGLAGTRAQVESARLASDASARIGASSTSTAASCARPAGRARRRHLRGQPPDPGVVGRRRGRARGRWGHVAASERLTTALAETLATTGGEPLDGYTAGIINATDDEIIAIVDEQNRQVDLAIAAGANQTLAVLGLSLVALAGVLAGIAAVLGRGKAGWLMLAIAWVVAGVAAVPAVNWLFEVAGAALRQVLIGSCIRNERPTHAARGEPRVAIARPS